RRGREGRIAATPNLQSAAVRSSRSAVFTDLISIAEPRNGRFTAIRLETNRRRRALLTPWPAFYIPPLRGLSRAQCSDVVTVLDDIPARPPTVGSQRNKDVHRDANRPFGTRKG